MIEGAVHMLQNVSKCYAQLGVLLLGSIHTHPIIIYDIVQHAVLLRCPDHCA